MIRALRPSLSVLLKDFAKNPRRLPCVMTLSLKTDVSTTQIRTLCHSRCLQQKTPEQQPLTPPANTTVAEDDSLLKDDEDTEAQIELAVREPAKRRDPRTRVIPVETSIRYIESRAYRETYGDKAVWVTYRRNLTRYWQPLRTREYCIDEGHLNTASACPICRDEYLVIDYRNVKLLNQFISPHTGEILPCLRTCLCEEKQFFMEAAIQKSRDHGLITFDVPFRHYDYEEYTKTYDASRS